MDLNNVITDDNLETTFSIIDTDKSGSLSAGELKLKLGSQLNE
jgi:Ca2+-binding EF-hand superfamily protein